MKILTNFDWISNQNITLTVIFYIVCNSIVSLVFRFRSKKSYVKMFKRESIIFAILFKVIIIYRSKYIFNIGSRKFLKEIPDICKNLYLHLFISNYQQ